MSDKGNGRMPHCRVPCAAPRRSRAAQLDRGVCRGSHPHKQDQKGASHTLSEPLTLTARVSIPRSLRCPARLGGISVSTAAAMREKELRICPIPVNSTKPTRWKAPTGPTWRVRMLFSRLRAEVPAQTTVRGTAVMAGPAPPSTCSMARTDRQVCAVAGV